MSLWPLSLVLVKELGKIFSLFNMPTQMIFIIVGDNFWFAFVQVMTPSLFTILLVSSI
jgi:hypothetical protein